MFAKLDPKIAGSKAAPELMIKIVWWVKSHVLKSLFMLWVLVL